MATGPVGFAAQFQELMFYAGSIAQLLYYIVLPIAAVWAVLLFKRMVSVRVADVTTHDLADAKIETSQQDEGSPVTGRPVKVEKFVE